MNPRSITIAAVLALLVVGGAMAQPQPAQRRAAVLASYLQLTPEQVASWKQIYGDTAAELKPLVANARDLREQLAAAVKSGADPAAIGKLTLSLASAREQVRAAREASKAKLEAVLTPEQKTKFEAFQAAVEFLKQRR